MEAGARGELLTSWPVVQAARSNDVTYVVGIYAAATVLSLILSLVVHNVYVAIVFDLLLYAMWAGIAYVFVACGTKFSHQMADMGDSAGGWHHRMPKSDEFVRRCCVHQYDECASGRYRHFCSRCRNLHLPDVALRGDCRRMYLFCCQNVSSNADDINYSSCRRSSRHANLIWIRHDGSTERQRRQ